MAPAARLDAIVGEVRAAVAWTIDHAKEHGGDPARVFVAGHSAGGHLTETVEAGLRPARLLEPGPYLRRLGRQAGFPPRRPRSA
jgi:acetyl esterase/lipase